MAASQNGSHCFEKFEDSTLLPCELASQCINIADTEHVGASTEQGITVALNYTLAPAFAEKLDCGFQLVVGVDDIYVDGDRYQVFSYHHSSSAADSDTS